MALFKKSPKVDYSKAKFQARYNDVVSDFGIRQIQLCVIDNESGLALITAGLFDTRLQLRNWLKANNAKESQVIWGSVSEVDEIMINDNRQYVQKRSYR